MRVANTLRARGATVDLEDVTRATSGVSLRRYGAVVIVASVHEAQYERPMVDFVTAHRRELSGVHSAFLSVSATDAEAEIRGASAAEHARSDADAYAMIESFCIETGWRPERIKPVAGALRYSQYGFVAHFLVRSPAKKPTDSTHAEHDVACTDWAALDHFVEDVSFTWIAPLLGVRSPAPGESCA